MKRVINVFTITILLITSCYVDEIKQNKGLTIGHIERKLEAARSGYTMRYSYVISDTVYYGMTTTIFNCNYKFFRGKYFHVVYSTINPEKSIMLLTPDDYAEWGYRFPDSLYWVTYCIK